MKLYLPALLTLPVVTSSWSLVPRYRSLFGPSLLDSTSLLSPTEMLRDFDNSFARTSPRYEITNTEQEMKIILDVPGVKAEDIDVNVDNENKVLSISGKREAGENGSSYRYQFSNSFSLSPEIDAEKLAADLKDGVLTVTAPKDMKRLEANIRKIPVMASAGEPEKIESAQEKQDEKVHDVEVKTDSKEKAHV